MCIGMPLLACKSKLLVIKYGPNFETIFPNIQMTNVYIRKRQPFVTKPIHQLKSRRLLYSLQFRCGRFIRKGRGIYYMYIFFYVSSQEILLQM